jgi:hypothetical protein
MPTSSTERMRRVRQRRREGVVLVKILVPGEAVSDLTALGWLPAGAPAKSVPDALVSMLNHALDCRVGPPRDLAPPTGPRPGYDQRGAA